MAPYVTVTGPKQVRSLPEATDFRGTRVQVPDSHSIPTSIPIAFSGRALKQDEIDAAIQTTATSKMRRLASQHDGT